MFNQYLNRIPETYFGRRSLDVLSTIKEKKIILVYGKSLEHNNGLDNILEKLKENSIEKLSPEGNTIGELNKLASKLEKPDIFVALGGGNVIDFSKILLAKIENPEIDFLKINKSTEIKRKTEFIIIPSTPSTGSQVTPVAITHDKSENKKIIVINDSFIPDKVILSSALLSSIKQEQMAEFICDIFAHCAESYLSRISNQFVKNLAEMTMIKLSEDWKDYLLEPQNQNYLDKLSFDGQAGGICQGNSYTGVMHSLAHQIEMATGKGHSKILLSIIKPVLEWYTKNDDKEIYKKFIEYFDNLNLDSYKENVLEGLNHEELAKRVINDHSIKTSPLIFNEEKVLDLIKWISRKK